MSRFLSALPLVLSSMVVIIGILLGFGSSTLETDHGQHVPDRYRGTIWSNWDTVFDDVLEHRLWPIASLADGLSSYHNPWHLPQLVWNFCHHCNLDNLNRNQHRPLCNTRTQEDTPHRPTGILNTAYKAVGEDETIRNYERHNDEIEHLQMLYQDNIERSQLIQKRIEDLQTHMRTLRNGISNEKRPITRDAAAEEMDLTVKSHSENSVDRNTHDRPLLSEEINERNKQNGGRINSGEQNTAEVHLNEKANVLEGKQRIRDNGKTEHKRKTVNEEINENKSNTGRNSKRNLIKEKQKSSDDQFLIIPLNGFLPTDLKISYHGNNNIRVYGSRTCKLEEGCVTKEMDVSYKLPSRFNKHTFNARIHSDNLILKENYRNRDSDDSIQSIYNNDHLHKDTIVEDDDDIWEKEQQTGDNKRADNFRTEETQTNIFAKHDEASSDSWVSIEIEE